MIEAPTRGTQNSKASSSSVKPFTMPSTGPSGVYSTASIVALIKLMTHTVDNAAPVKTNTTHMENHDGKPNNGIDK